jgi:P-type Cu+ transporter
MTVNRATAAAHVDYAGQAYAFCSQGCARAFTADPLAHLAAAPDPVCGMTVPVAGAEWTTEHDGLRYVFCGAGCRDRFDADHPRRPFPPMAHRR